MMDDPLTKAINEVAVGHAVDKVYETGAKFVGRVFRGSRPKADSDESRS